jgi:RNA polymerase sigma-70 factor (ECF subfamily)
MGGDNRAFPVTQWAQIINFKMSHEDQRALIINELLKRYWKPIYCYLRRKGYDNETAKDLTQGFFMEVVLARHLVQQACQARGRFRTFLLTAIDRYVIDLHRYETTNKRKPDRQIFKLDDLDYGNLPTVSMDSNPEQSFNYAWISDLLDRIFAKVKHELLDTDMQTHWNVFEEKILKPIINSSKPPSLKEICAKYGIRDEKTASNMIITVRRRLRKSMERHLRQYAQSDSQVEKEIYEMYKVF